MRSGVLNLDLLPVVYKYRDLNFKIRYSSTLNLLNTAESTAVLDYSYVPIGMNLRPTLRPGGPVLAVTGTITSEI